MFNIPNGYDQWLKKFYQEDYISYTPDNNKRYIHNKDCYYK